MPKYFIQLMCWTRCKCGTHHFLLVDKIYHVSSGEFLREKMEFQDRKAAANLPPKPQKPIWQPKHRKKKKNNMT
ncbi:hypothetical protein pdam_00003979, partial [Pocillopora damicornis]